MELVLGLILFSIFVGIQGIFSEFADDIKLCPTVDMLKGRDVIQRDRLEKWAHAKLTKLNKAKCEILPLGQGNPRHTYRLGGEVTESSQAEKDLGMMVNKTQH
ncbi:hypothetical protein WISP_147665 [Willisornis vidua]|uniref:Uncharacterized protein n=1 Tax=Willisornis vidua TaxID=1566151 RepID=A0ABQ9CKE6_9PASS|nr:hypothetical protein WISP_147665 [Willisornis vidua]